MSVQLPTVQAINSLILSNAAQDLGCTVQYVMEIQRGQSGTEHCWQDALGGSGFLFFAVSTSYLGYNFTTSVEPFWIGKPIHHN